MERNEITIGGNLHEGYMVINIKKGGIAFMHALLTCVFVTHIHQFQFLMPFVI